MLPTSLALKLFKAQIAPILLYGSEVWGPYMEYDYENWDKSKIEMVYTQYLNRILGCSYQTSNIMVRGELGVRPLIIDIIKRVIYYITSIKQRSSSTVHSTIEFENNINLAPNLTTFINKFQLNPNIIAGKKKEINNICKDDYDRYWKTKISESPKAITYAMFKSSVHPEKYLFELKNRKHKICLSRFRLSNHNLLIEKGRHVRPKIERENRKCFICPDEVENEVHFLTKCRIYQEERNLLYQSCREICYQFDSIQTSEQIFTFILSNENPSLIKAIARFVYNSFKIREIQFQNISANK